MLGVYVVGKGKLRLYNVIGRGLGERVREKKKTKCHTNGMGGRHAATTQGF